MMSDLERTTLQYNGRIDTDWNLVTGCTRTEKKCRRCRSQILKSRLGGTTCPARRYGIGVQLHSERLYQPLSWLEPRTVFVCPQSDLTLPGVPAALIKDAFRIMRRTPQHRFQVLTMHPTKLALLSTELSWAENIHVGATFETLDHADRVEILRDVPAARRFLYVDSLRCPVEELDLRGIDSLVVGLEGGALQRADAERVLEIVNLCSDASVQISFRRWGAQSRRHRRSA